MSYKDKDSFVAYKGSSIDKHEIYKKLSQNIDDEYSINDCDFYYNDDYYFAKIVPYKYAKDCGPYNYAATTSVSGIIQNEQKLITDNLNISWDLYIDIKSVEIGIEKIFKKSNNGHFCSVIYDRNNHLFIAGVTEPINEFTHLYYGYPNDDEILYSNNKDIVKEFCEHVYEMKANTYMKDNAIYNLDGEKLESRKQNMIKEDNMTLIKKNKENSDSLIDGLNALLAQVVNDSVKNKVENTLKDYLNSDDNKKKIEDYLLKELDSETKKELLIMIKKAVRDLDTEEKINEQLTSLFDEKLQNYIKDIAVPVNHIIKLNDTILGQTKEGFYHKKFEQILTQVQLEEPIMLIGPAGSGKNVAIKQVADALGLHMYYVNNASNEFKLTGFIDAGGTYRETEFYKAFKNGGVFFLDEIDNSDPSALIVINSALANGYMAFPHETIDQHPDFRMIAAANTWGKGSDLEYVGRNALDASTLDRFDNIYFDYDRHLEKALYPNDEVLDFMWSFRDSVEESKIPHIVSTRGIGKVYKKEVNGISVENILTSNIIKNLNQDDVNMIIGNMRNIYEDNKYYSGIKRLRLR